MAPAGCLPAVPLVSAAGASVTVVVVAPAPPVALPTPPAVPARAVVASQEKGKWQEYLAAARQPHHRPKLGGGTLQFGVGWGGQGAWGGPTQPHILGVPPTMTPGRKKTISAKA